MCPQGLHEERHRSWPAAFLATPQAADVWVTARPDNRTTRQLSAPLPCQPRLWENCRFFLMPLLCQAVSQKLRGAAGSQTTVSKEKTTGVAPETQWGVLLQSKALWTPLCGRSFLFSEWSPRKQAEEALVGHMWSLPSPYSRAELMAFGFIFTVFYEHYLSWSCLKAVRILKTSRKRCVITMEAEVKPDFLWTYSCRLLVRNLLLRRAVAAKEYTGRSQFQCMLTIISWIGRGGRRRGRHSRQDMLQGKAT